MHLPSIFPGLREAVIPSRPRTRGLPCRRRRVLTSCLVPGQLGVPKIKETFSKMVTHVEDGPKPSGNGKAVDQLTLQDLKDINIGVAAFNVTTNDAIQQACPTGLDDQEGRGFVGADLLGAELVPTHVAPTEAHKVGLQIDDLLREAKEADERHDVGKPAVQAR